MCGEGVFYWFVWLLLFELCYWYDDVGCVELVEYVVLLGVAVVFDLFGGE